MCQPSVQPCSAGCVELPLCVLSSPEPIQLLLHFVQIPPLVCAVIIAPVSLWRLFQLYVTFLAEKSNTCACVEHSYDWFILPGAVGADVKNFLQWGTKRSCSKVTMCPVGGPNALVIAEISTVLTVWAATVLVCLLITSLQATCSRYVGIALLSSRHRTISMFKFAFHMLRSIRRITKALVYCIAPLHLGCIHCHNIYPTEHWIMTVAHAKPGHAKHTCGCEPLQSCPRSLWMKGTFCWRETSFSCVKRWIVYTAHVRTLQSYLSNTAEANSGCQSLPTFIHNHLHCLVYCSLSCSLHL